VIRTNNGGEFTSDKFKRHYSDHGILHQLTVPYSPQQNNVVE
jgi:transposase InsO family protein